VHDWDQGAVARAEERRCAIAVSETVAEVVPFGGGFLCYDAPGSWANIAIGVGLDGPAAEGDLARLVAFYRERGAPPRIELAPTADRSWIEGLAAAGFVIRKFENVFFRVLPEGEALPHASPASIRPVDLDDPADVRRHAEVVASGFAGREGPSEADLLLGERIVRHPRTIALFAEIDGQVVGAGTAEDSPPVGALFGLTVLPEFRRQGIQLSLVAARLEVLRERGCTVATISSEPGVATERNARRMGFQLAYTKVQLEAAPSS
jgi:GNAT superfamily N-acetyltransferase